MERILEAMKYDFNGGSDSFYYEITPGLVGLFFPIGKGQSKHMLYFDLDFCEVMNPSSFRKMVSKRNLDVQTYIGKEVGSIFLGELDNMHQVILWSQIYFKMKEKSIGSMIE